VLGYGAKKLLFNMAGYSGMGSQLTSAVFWGVLLSPVLMGTIMIIRNGIRLWAKKPQVIISGEGIYCASYSAWNTIAWQDIVAVRTQLTDSMTSYEQEPSIVIKLSQQKAAKVFEDDLIIKTDYLELSREEILQHIESFQDNDNSTH
jgi:hypothetical protein